MPPELLRGTGGDGHEPGLSDAWALGCVASFCLRGRPLYLGNAKEVKSDHSSAMLRSCSISISPLQYPCKFKTELALHLSLSLSPYQQGSLKDNIPSFPPRVH